MSDKPKGRLAVMGNITIDEAGQMTEYPKALLIVFDSAEDIRRAIQDMDFDMVHWEPPQQEPSE